MSIINNNDLREYVRVLHVDDEPNQLVLTKRFLELEDPAIQVVPLTSPEKAQSLLKKQSFDCIVSDYMMPRLDGIEFAKDVRKHSHVPFIIYTGRGSEEVAEAAFQNGIDDYIRKELEPSHYKVLAKRIRSVVEKHRAEKDLIESEEKFRTLSEYSTNMIFINQNGKVVYANKRCEEVMGYTREEFYSPNFNFLSLVTPECLDSVKENFKKHTNGEEVDPLDYSLLTKEGRRMEGILSTKLITYRGESAILGIVVDITERKQMEKELEASKKHLENLFKSLVDPVVIVDGNGTFLEITDKVEEVTGFKREELLGKSFMNTKIVTRKSKAILIKNLFKRMIGMHITPYEIEVLTKDGRKLPYEVNAARIDYKGKPADMVVFRNISQRKKMEESVRKSEDQTRKLLEFQSKVIDTAIVWINLLDTEGNVILWNRAAELISGYSRKEVVGHKKIWEWLYPDQEYSAEIFEQAKDIIKEGRQVENFETTIRCKDGTFKTILWYDNNILDKDGNPMGSIAVGIDITEQKKAEQKLLEYTNHLEEMAEEKTRELLDAERMVAAGKVAAMVGHDIRGPLQTIKNAIDLLRRKSDKAEEILKMADSAVDRAGQMLEEIRNQTLDSPLNIVTTDLATLIRTAVEEAPKRSSIDISMEFGGDLEAISIDSMKIRRVLDNLIANAFDAMPKGGKLVISAKVKDGTVFIDVSDTGVGIPEEERHNIFKPFQTTKPKGMGLGLAYCKRAVDAHNGTIKVESKVGEGTTFTIALPDRSLLNTLHTDFITSTAIQAHDLHDIPPQ